MAQEAPGQTLQATALVHEAYVRLVDGQQPQHWGAVSVFNEHGLVNLWDVATGRRALDEELQSIIAKTIEWGITVQSVKLRDVRISPALEDAMIRKAQADREKEARALVEELGKKDDIQSRPQTELEISVQGMNGIFRYDAAKWRPRLRLATGLARDLICAARLHKEVKKAILGETAHRLCFASK